MPFLLGDRSRLVDALQLVVTQDDPISLLATLMIDVELRDTTNSTDRAGQIRLLVDKIESAQDSLDSIDDAVLTETQKGPITEETVVDHYTRQYGSGSGGGQTTEGMKIERLNNMRQRIKRLLDPYGYLNRYRGVGRAIDG